MRSKNVVAVSFDHDRAIAPATKERLGHIGSLADLAGARSADLGATGQCS